ncbi:MAG: hypothetical protein GC201_09915 [Alphaproteobacteria bacterium]|nr:hypothetical protein [Alphaproteobacteria bacterium]
MKRALLCAALVASMMGMSGHAGAETIAKAGDLKPDSAFADFLRSKQHAKVRALVALREDTSVNRACRDAYTMGEYQLRIIQPIEMTKGAQIPSAGKWVERFKVTRCGRQSQFNAIFMVDDQGKLEVTPVAPGETGQDFQLVLDLRDYVEKRARIPNCDKRGLLDTAKGPPEGYEPRVPGGTYETWTVSGCGKDIDMVLLFTPQEGGKMDVKVEKQIPR